MSEHPPSQFQSKKPSDAEIAAKRAARAAKKEAAELAAKRKAAEGAATPTVDSRGRPLFAHRQWESVQGASEGSRGLRIVSWNMLAQGLVRRKLFPGSDCLKWKDREAGLSAELCANSWDVGAFQEVDRIDSHKVTLGNAGYNYVYSKGYPQKAHGLLIAWRTRPRKLAGEAYSICFAQEALAQRTIFLDDTLTTPAETCCSRETRNIALFVAVGLKSDDTSRRANDIDPSTERRSRRGIIVATTHLFWHPMHAYERARQSGIIVRELDRFRRDLGPECRSWPTVLAGDFNDQPHSATYHLLTGQGLSSHPIDEIERSTVIHQSIDNKAKRVAEAKAFTSDDGAKCAEGTDSTVHESNGTIVNAADEETEADEEDDVEEEEEGGADDQMLKNCRAPQRGELLSVEELKQLHDLSRPLPRTQESGIAESVPMEQTGSLAAPLRSTYGSAYARVPSGVANTFSHASRGRERWDEAWSDDKPNQHSDVQAGRDEPMWTIFSSLFSLTLDYIFLLPSPADNGGQGNQAIYSPVLSLLPTHRTEVLRPGIPRLGVCASDHIAIGAEIEL